MLPQTLHNGNCDSSVKGVGTFLGMVTRGMCTLYVSVILTQGTEQIQGNHFCNSKELGTAQLSSMTEWMDLGIFKVWPTK
jgi:hypothetical protein